jgi:hypothetical protein
MKDTLSRLPEGQIPRGMSVLDQSFRLRSIPVSFPLIVMDARQAEAPLLRKTDSGRAPAEVPKSARNGRWRKAESVFSEGPPS